MRWLILIGLLVCFVLLQRGLWFTTSSVPHGWKLAGAVAKEQRDNQALRAENAERWAEVKDLKKGGEAIEAHARMDLGLVKPGETFYQIVPAPQAATAPSSAAGGGLPVAPPPATTRSGG